MRSSVFSTAALAALGASVLATCGTPAYAADMVVKAPPPVVTQPSPFDIAFGAALMNDYIFRGISQSNRKPSVAAYFEPRFNITNTVQLYAGIAGESISFPNRAAAEIDFYGGIRPTFGPVTFDLGFWYYAYPGGEEFSPAVLNGPLPNGNIVKSRFDFYEIYGKVSWTVAEPFVLGANLYYSPNILNTGATGTYLSGTAKYTFPAFANGLAMYVSGELGRQWLGTTDAFYGSVPLKSYTTWNAGLGFTYKVFTLDLRYSDTTLGKVDCNNFTGDHTAGLNAVGQLESKWCGAAFIAKLSADLTLDSLK